MKSKLEKKLARQAKQTEKQMSATEEIARLMVVLQLAVVEKCFQRGDVFVMACNKRVADND